MLAALSFENLLLRRLRDKWLMSADAFSLLASWNGYKGCGKAQLSAALSGSRALSNEVTVALRPLISELDQLVEICSPLPLNLKNATEIHLLLQAKREGRLEINVKFTPADGVPA